MQVSNWFRKRGGRCSRWNLSPTVPPSWMTTDKFTSSTTTTTPPFCSLSAVALVSSSPPPSPFSSSTPSFSSFSSSFLLHSFVPTVGSSSFSSHRRSMSRRCNRRVIFLFSFFFLWGCISRFLSMLRKGKFSKRV